MTALNSAGSGHLSNDVLVRAMDEELSGSEMMQVETHLAKCGGCLARQADLRRVSDGLESFLRSYQPAFTQPETGWNGRQALLNRLDASKQGARVSGTGKTLARFGWMLAAAAMLAIGISYVPFSRMFNNGEGAGTLSASARFSQPGAPFEIDGETFQYLPYSNPDLPVGGSHIVQMQVPLSSLADAGVLVAPAANRITTPDRAVLADVLLGMDGQPIGVHVLSAD